MADNDDGWKEQLAFVSGYILVFGFAVMKLWPLAAGFQTGISVNAWTMNLPSEGVNTALLVFTYLTTALGMALTAITLAIVHILSRGLWLAFFSGPSANPLMDGISRLLDRLRRITYDAAFFLLPFGGLVLFLGALILISAGIENELGSTFGLSVKAAGWIARLLVTSIYLVLFLFAAFKLYPRFMNALQEGRIPNLTSMSVALGAAMILFMIMWVIVVQTCFTAEVNVAGKVFQRGRGDLVEVDFTLGGSASALNLAQFKLSDSRGVSLGNVAPQDLGGGHYVATIQSRDLPGGRYQVTLEYPHSSFDSSFPFVHSRIAARQWFLVLP